jgi:LmbE family N-acetylglucosaminyl deacetylase
VAANDPGQPPLNPESGSAGWTVNLAVPRSALAIGAHPDDVEFGAGGTLAKWAAGGCVVHYVVCTDGSKGSWDPAANVNELVTRRASEQREAARRLAGDRTGTVVFLGRVDGELDSDRTTRGDVARVIRELRPDVVLGHDPWKRYRLHSDHRHAGWLACDGVVAARDPHFHPEHALAPHRPSALLLWEADQPSHVEDVTAVVERKLHALEAHVSQFESTMRAVDDEQLAAFRARVRTRLADLGAPHGFAAAEVFALIRDL